jgi:hypothetical protein
MTAAEMAALIGRDAEWGANGLTVAVTIVDVKQAWGRLRYQITPVVGRGKVWVEHLQILGAPTEASSQP